MRGRRASTKVATTGLQVQGPASWLRRDWFWGLILTLLVILVYTPVWKAGFVWDDNEILTANPCIVGPLGLKEIWTTSAADICPLTLSTFWVEHALWGLNPLPYHLVNVLLHGACALLLWQVLRSLRVQGAWLGAALWALHPLVVESVAWVTETKNTESGLFFLLSIFFFVRWLKAKGLPRGDGNAWNYALTLLFAALAMASKSSTVILPVVLCLCAWWLDGRWRWRNVVRVFPTVLMAIAAGAVSIWTQRLALERIVSDPQWARTWPERLVAAGDAIWFYLSKLLWPHPLITIYPRWQIDANQWVSYLPLLTAIVMLSIFWLKRELWSRACFFALAYFLVALLPVLGLIDNSIFRLSLVFDHLQYLASIGPLALVGAGLVLLSNVTIPKKRWLQTSLCGAMLLVLGMASWQRTLVYESDEALWTDTLVKNPDCWSGHNNLGNDLIRKGQLDEALVHLQKALEIYPNFLEAHNSLGEALLRKGQVDEAVAQYREALEINPRYVDAHYNLGNALLQKGQLDEAVAEFQRALEINPSSADVRNNLGNALLQKGQLDEAIAQLQKALEFNSEDADVRSNLGNALLQKGQLDEAVLQFQKASEIRPNNADAYYNLGNALLQKGQLDEAVPEYQRAVEINPSYADARNNLGVALLQKGRLDEAITQFHEVLRLKPDFSPAQDNLARAQSLVRQTEGHERSSP